MSQQGECYQSEKVGTGVLGRMLDVLESKNFTVEPFGIESSAPILEGKPERSRKVDV